MSPGTEVAGDAAVSLFRGGASSAAPGTRRESALARLWRPVYRCRSRRSTTSCRPRPPRCRARPTHRNMTPMAFSPLSVVSWSEVSERQPLHRRSANVASMRSGRTERAVAVFYRYRLVGRHDHAAVLALAEGDRPREPACQDILPRRAVFRIGGGRGGNELATGTLRLPPLMRTIAARPRQRRPRRRLWSATETERTAISRTSRPGARRAVLRTNASITQSPGQRKASAEQYRGGRSAAPAARVSNRVRLRGVADRLET